MIRSVAPGDLWSLRRRPRNQVVLYNEALLAQSHQPFWFALGCLLQGTGRDRLMMVYHDRGNTAVIQSQARRNRPEQDVLFLATLGPKNTTLPSDRDIWFRVLEQLCQSAGQHHVQRLYAALPNQHSDAREIFRQLGFQSYTHGSILHLSGPDWDQRTTIAPMRAQSRRDHWAIHKLYGAVTPHLVQHAEARNARVWALPFTQRNSNYRRRAWVIGPDDDLFAYLRLASGSSGHVLSLLVHPNARDMVVDIIRFGLAQLNDARPVYILLREYQSELIAPIQDLGFAIVSEQNLLVKSMVVPVRRFMLVPSFDTHLEPHATVSNILTPREGPYSYVGRSGHNG